MLLANVLHRSTVGNEYMSKRSREAIKTQSWILSHDLQTYYPQILSISLGTGIRFRSTCCANVIDKRCILNIAYETSTSLNTSRLKKQKPNNIALISMSTRGSVKHQYS